MLNLALRQLRAKRLTGPLLYAITLLLLIATLVAILRSRSKEVDVQQQQQQPELQQQPLVQRLQQKNLAKSESQLLSEIVEKVKKELQQKQGRIPGKQEVLHRVQQLLGSRQLGQEIKDLEHPGSSRSSSISKQQLLQLPKPHRSLLARVVLRPRFTNCDRDKSPHFVVLVHTTAAEIAYRNAIRETWYSPLKSHTKYLRSRPHLWKVIFTTGAATGDNLQREIQEESSVYGDILQFAFVDSQHTATQKTVNAVLELSQHDYFKRCTPKFLLKVTDDTFVNMPAFTHWLAAKFSSGNHHNIYIGHTVHADRPDRNSARSTYIPAEDYPFETLPDYNKNPAYMFSWNLIGRLATEVKRVQPIIVDDAYIGILMARLGISPQFNDHFVMLEGPMDVCMHLRMFFISHLPPIEVLNVFERNSKGRQLNECKDVLPYNADKMDL